MEFKKSDLFLKTLNKTNIKLEEYVSWDDINENMQDKKWYCNQLNFLLSKSEEEFLNKFNLCFEKLKDSFSILPILITQKSFNFYFYIQNEIQTLDINNLNNVLNFIKESGLLMNVFLNELCKDIYTYCFGVEVGLNSNSHKNKSGKWASLIFEQIIKKHKISNLQKEIPISKIFNNITNTKEFRTKKIDYFFVLRNKKYIVELNYFNYAGSKINSEADRFIGFNKWIHEQKNNDIEFLYITDGLGWLKHKNKLEEVLINIRHCYNFNLLENEFFLKNK